MSVNKVNQSTGELSPISGGTLYADAPVGSIQAYGGNSAPWGWLLCQGQAISRATYAELFNVIGTSFGAGDGSTTFNVPDLRETVPVGSGTRGSGVTTHDTYTVGQFKDDQVQDHTHVYLHIPQDTHSDLHIPSGSGYAYGNLYTYSTGTPNSGRHGDTTHGKQLGVNYIIKATSIALPSDFEAAVDDKIAIRLLSANEIFTANTGFSIYAIDAYEQNGIVTLNVSVNATTATASGNIGYVNSSYVPADCFGKVIGAGLARLTSMTTGAAYPLGSWLMPNGQVFIQTTTASSGFSVHLQWRKP